jgi:hypothetical protein
MQVLTWSANDQFSFGGGIPETETATFNPSTGAVSAKTITNTNHDMFCPGISMLGTGEIVVTGGNNAEKTSIYVPARGAWVPGPNMKIPRGYQASTLLSTGAVRRRWFRASRRLVRLSRVTQTNRRSSQHAQRCLAADGLMHVVRRQGCVASA